MSDSRAEEPTATSPSRAPHPPAPAQQALAPGPNGHLAPYQYPYAQPTFAAQPRVIPFDKTWHWIKIALTSASLVFCVILLGISIAISIGPGYDSWNITIYWVGPLVGVVGIWDIAEFITICACGKRNGAEQRRGIHPGAHVGLDLCIWLAGILCVFISAVSYVSARSQLMDCQDEQNSDSDLSSSYRYYNYCDDDEYEMLSTGIYIPAIRAVMAFLSLLTLVHFIIFVRACTETNQRNRSRATVMMMPPQMYYGPPGGMAPYGYPMMPPQAYTGNAQGTALNEKSPATAAQPPGNSSNLAGFYAPPGPAYSHHAQSQQSPREPTAAGSSA
ncbi:hypothetical protein SCAR479_05238 [Seiridium cardinale]|uniref:Uncharacterized protein n=1 Tax=Seiridium cardinale TaxID=138064 RepID=A0ABR2XWT0_9PEZI